MKYHRGEIFCSKTKPNMRITIISVEKAQIVEIGGNLKNYEEYRIVHEKSGYLASLTEEMLDEFYVRDV